MFAGGPAINDSANTSPQLIRFAVKANRVEYDYVAKNQERLTAVAQMLADLCIEQRAAAVKK